MLPSCKLTSKEAAPQKRAPPNRQMWLLSSFLIVAGVVMGLMLMAPLLTSQSANPEPPSYIGPKLCGGCHPSQYSEWSNSVHSRVLRPATPENLYPAPSAPPGHNLDEFKYVVGNSRNVRFITNDLKVFTGDQAQWNTLVEAWIPYTGVEEGVAGSEGLIDYAAQCAQCHVTDFNSTSLSWTIPDITCESCHGPGSDHLNAPSKAARKATISVDLSAELCGRCHTQPTPRPYAYHQQYNDWSKSNHSRSLTHLKSAPDAEDECLRCHSAEKVLFDGNVTLQTARNPITCAVCHSPHTQELRSPEPTLCATCHSTASFGPSLVKGPQTEMYGGSIMEEAGVTCVDCHMPLAVKSGGRWNAHNHTAGLIDPEVSVQDPEAPNSCTTTCHKTKDAGWAREAIDAKAYVFNALLSEVQEELERAREAIEDAQASGVNPGTLKTLQETYSNATYAMNFATADGSKGLHNSGKALRMLNEARLNAIQVRVDAKNAQTAAELPLSPEVFYPVLISVVIVGVLGVFYLAVFRGLRRSPKLEETPLPPPHETEG